MLVHYPFITNEEIYSTFGLMPIYYIDYENELTDLFVSKNIFKEENNVS